MPHTIRIGMNSISRRLYQAEEERTKAIKKAAKELAKVLGHSEDEFWSKTMPQALFDILISFDTTAATEAATAFLEENKKL